MSKDLKFLIHPLPVIIDTSLMYDRPTARIKACGVLRRTTMMVASLRNGLLIG